MGLFSSKEELSHQLQEESVQGLREAFNIFDQDNDGQISKKEYITFLRILGVNESESHMKNEFKIIDQNRNDMIDFSEFSDLITSQLKPKTLEEHLIHAFQIIDKDANNGIIDRDQLEYFLQNFGDPLTQEELLEFFSDIDPLNTGRINSLEFCQRLFD